MRIISTIPAPSTTCPNTNTNTNTDETKNVARNRHIVLEMSTVGAGEAGEAGHAARLCSVCLGKTRDTEDLLFVCEVKDEFFTAELKLLDLARDFLGMKEEPEPPLRRICKCCIQQLTNFYIFFKRYQMNRHILQSAVHKYKNENCDSVPRSEFVLQLDTIHDKLCQINLNVASTNDAIVKTNQSKPFKTIEYQCSMCALNFLTKEDLLVHKKIHPPDSMHICRKDGSLFKTPVSLRRHKQRCHGRKQSFICSECGKLLRNRDLLTRHLKIHAGTKFNCEKCLKSFLTSARLQTHKKIHEESKNAVICEECGKICKSPGNLRVHQHSHNIKRCPYCSVDFKNYPHFKAHLKKHETGISRKQTRTKYYCDSCDFRSLNKKSLEAHINKVHLNVRPYKCNVCQTSFYKKSNLVEHIMIHTRESTEVCHICGDTFVNKRRLLEHFRLHSGEKPYQCDVCNESFVTAGRRTEHNKRKHLAKSEICHLCNKSFSLRKVLNRHINNVHSTSLQGNAAK